MPGPPPHDGELAAILQLVTDTITASLGFEVAATSLVAGDDDVVVVACSGPDEVRDQLVGVRRRMTEWQQLLDASEPWGKLRFLDHRTVDTELLDQVMAWTPDLPVSDDPEAWHPDDALFALLSSSTGRPLGMLSVDVPRSGRRPGPEARQALEAFAITASLAIEHASLAAEARQGRRRFQAVFDSSPIPVALLGPDRTYLRVNAAFCRFLHRAPDELLGRDLTDFTHPDDVGSSRQLTEAISRAGASAQQRAWGPLEKRFLLPDGRAVWGRLHVATLPDDREAGVLVAQIEDVTARRQAEDRLRRQAERDGLTGLPNRAATVRCLELALARDLRSGRVTGVFFCDVDHLKWLNDTCGHAVGDRYLQEIGARLAGAVRGSDTVGRIGGDEFVVVAPGLSDTDEAGALARRVLDAVRTPWREGPDTLTPSLSLGVALASGGTMTADELLSRADVAMYRAKTDERGSWRLWDPTELASVPDLSLRSAVPGALARSELALHYQPIVRLADRVVIGHEALLRWQHPRLGLLSPDRFLDVVLNSEHEGPVTDWAIRQACRQAAERRGVVTVNLSSVQVSRPDLPEVVAAALREAALPAGRLVLELTEDRLLSRPDSAQRLADLRALGVGVALDDFGSGWAGLQYLHRFPALTALKLDRSFVAGLGADPVSEKIVRSTVALAADCGLDLVVEGVETVEQAEVVSVLGAPLAQGWHFGRPAPWAPLPLLATA